MRKAIMGSLLAAAMLGAFVMLQLGTSRPAARAASPRITPANFNNRPLTSQARLAEASPEEIEQLDATVALNNVEHQAFKSDIVGDGSQTQINWLGFRNRGNGKITALSSVSFERAKFERNVALAIGVRTADGDLVGAWSSAGQKLGKFGVYTFPFHADFDGLEPGYYRLVAFVYRTDKFAEPPFDAPPAMTATALIKVTP